jgi:hypothetical protein
MAKNTTDHDFFRPDRGHFSRSTDLRFMIRSTIKPTPSTTTQKPAQLVVRSNVKAGHVWSHG